MHNIHVKPCDVFISWTGADAQIKDDIQRRLTEGGLTVLISDMHCYGNFVDWSRAAATSATVFVAVITENSLSSKGMLWELEEIHKKLDNPAAREWWSHHIIPICATEKLYKEADICADFRNCEISAVLMDKSKDMLEELYARTVDCILSGFYAEYRRNVREEYIKISALYSDFEDERDINFDFAELYVPRKITCREDETALASPRGMMQMGQVSFLRGAAGSGKSRYINQIYGSAQEDELVIALKCTDASRSEESLFNLMYRRFHSVCGDRVFYTPESFAHMLSAKKLILVLDGIDEVTTGAATAALAEKVQEYFIPNSASTALIFTGRSEKDLNQLVIGDYEVKKYCLEPLDEKDIHTLGTKLFVLMGDSEKGEDFYVSLSALDSEIRSNPMLLSQLAAIYSKTGTLLRTVAEILEAVLKITLNLEETKPNANILPVWREMVENDINDILNRFAYKKYVSMSEGENYTFTRLLQEVLGDKYDEDDTALAKRTRFLSGYLQKRAIVNEGEFSHKMFLEYFTAVYCYNASFRNRALKKPEAVGELFSHYADPYWEAVIKLYLAKADSVIKADTAHQLFSLITTFGIKEYTLLFDACRELVNHRQTAQRVFAGDILKKSADGAYPPYGPLFWYVPKYRLYPVLLQALSELEPNAAAAALVRDVCVLNGRFSARELMGADAIRLFDSVKSALTGVRYGLCQLFYTGSTDCTEGYDVYPRLFNIRETKAWMQNGCGTLCRMTSPFKDEIGLYSHSMYNIVENEYIGIACAVYDKDEISRTLSLKPCNKLCGLFLSDGEDTQTDYIPFSRGNIKHLFVPENTVRLCRDHDLHMSLDVKAACNKDGIIYYSDRLYIDGTDGISDGMFADNYLLEKVYIGAGVRTLGINAFKNCVSLKSIALPEGVEEIGAHAFFGCHELSEIDFPQSLKSIGKYAFFGCESLTAVTLPDKITEINSHTFCGCSHLMTAELPQNLTAIYDGAFSKCGGITFITIPPTVKTIGAMAFSSCKRLMSIAIPDGVECIASYLFGGCDSLVSAELPETVTEIEGGAFDKCRRLKTIKLPESINKIGMTAFSDCESLERIELPDSIRCINNATFDGCVSLREIKLPQSLESVGLRAFSGCESLTALHFARGLSNIHHFAFENCRSLSSVTLPDSLEYIGFGDFMGGSHVFDGCEALSEIKIPDSVREMGENTFYKCKNLARITLPQRFEGRERYLGIPEGTEVEFIRTEKTERILVIPDGTAQIADSAYENDLTIVGVIIPEGVEKIGKNAFYGCENLVSAKLPQSLTAIGQGAFCACISLKSIVIPQGVTVIEKNTFECCESLETVEIQGNIVSAESHAFEGCTKLESINLPDSLIEIEDYAFCDCCCLSEINLPNGLEEIGEGAFGGCSELCELTLPAAVTNIRKYAFEGCESLSDITLHDGVTMIGARAFERCRSLENITLPEALSYIGEGAFEGCEMLMDIKIPDSVRFIGKQAFSRCESLSSITVPRGVCLLGKADEEEEGLLGSGGVFSDCTNLQSVRLECRITELENDLFRDCSSLREVILPETLETIGFSAFSGCTELENIVIPENVTEIGFYAFWECSCLKTIKIPSGVTCVGRQTFDGCTSLCSIDLHENISVISANAFKNCTALKQITLHDGIRRIGKGAFEGCTGLERVRLSANLKELVPYVFGDIDTKIIEYI